MNFKTTYILFGALVVVLGTALARLPAVVLALVVVLAAAAPRGVAVPRAALGRGASAVTHGRLTSAGPGPGPMERGRRGVSGAASRR